MVPALGDTPGWFQLYPPNDRGLWESFVGRAEGSGWSAIAVTLTSIGPTGARRSVARLASRGSIFLHSTVWRRIHFYPPELCRATTPESKIYVTALVTGARSRLTRGYPVQTEQLLVSRAMISHSPDAPLIVVDGMAWRSWLIENDDCSDGIWLALAKEGTTTPTSLGYQAALEEALCSGWIDGQRRSFDLNIFVQRFTPRRAGSIWSKRNVSIVDRLLEEDRIRPRGSREIDRAKSDGRWQRAYSGSADAEVPAALTEALSASPQALAAFEKLNRSDRYSALHPILAAPNEVVRTRRIATLIERLGVKWH